jgi:hypothetical protein
MSVVFKSKLSYNSNVHIINDGMYIFKLLVRKQAYIC